MKSRSFMYPRGRQARLRARSGSVCQCRCWAGGQKLAAPARKRQLFKEQRAGSHARPPLPHHAASCPPRTPPSPPNPQRWDCQRGEHRSGGLGQTAPLDLLSVAMALALGGILGQGTLCWGLPAPFSHPVLSGGGPATGDAGLPPARPGQHRCTVGSGMRQGPSR